MKTVSIPGVSKFAAALALVLVALALPASAFGQATRTWVSGVGDDANPCSRTAPCKTFAGAISKTAASGEINCLDPGGFGGVTINKALTIDCHYTQGGVLVSGTNAIVVNAGPSDKVILRGLDINGLGTSLVGIKVLAGKNVRVKDVNVYGFTQSAVVFASSTAGSHGLVANSELADNGGDGVYVGPPTGTTSLVTVRNTLIDNDQCGIVATSHSPGSPTGVGSNCGANFSLNSGTAKLSAFGNSITNNVLNNGIGAFAAGPNGLIRLGDNEITDNLTGILALDTGAAGGITSFGDNYITGNTTADGTPTRTISRSKH
jgi:hypothetical protein